MIRATLAAIAQVAAVLLLVWTAGALVGLFVVGYRMVAGCLS